MTGKRWIRTLLMTAAAVLGMAATSQAGEYYYALIFGSQDHPKHLRNTHTWVTIVRAVGEGPDLANYQLCHHTISWYPASMRVRVWSLSPEPGANLTLEQSLAAVYANGEGVKLWGPFAITPDVYNRSVVVYDQLASGRVQYRAISTSADLFIADCIHAVAAMDPIFGRNHYPLIRIGFPASRYIAREIQTRSLANRGVDQRWQENGWILPRLGLDRYPIDWIPPGQIPLVRCAFCKLPD